MGVRLHSVAIQAHGHERALYATKPISPGDVLICIPRSCALIVNIADDLSPSLQVLKPRSPPSASLLTTPWYVRLAIRLLDEQLCASKSPFAAYVDALPIAPSTALYAAHTMSASLVFDQLAAFAMDDTARAYYNSITNSFHAFHDSLPDSQKSLLTLHDFIWAISVVVSRAFGIPPVSTNQDSVKAPKAPLEFALFPAFDMANHSIHANTDMRFNRQTDSFELIAGVQSQPGQQVYVSYGTKSNDDLVLFYGFVEISNEGNQVTILDFRQWLLELAYAQDDGQLQWDHKLDLLRHFGLLKYGKMFAFRTESIEKDLMLALRIVMATSDQLDHFDQLRHNTDPKQLTKPLSLSNETAAWRAIEHYCQHLMRQCGHFDDHQVDRIHELIDQPMCTEPWTWGEADTDAELLLRYQRYRVLDDTIERVRHFTHISTTIGRVCTVLMPPSQSVLRTEKFAKPEGGRNGESGEVFDLQRFIISPKDIEAQLGT